MKQIRAHLTYANVMSTLAVFLVLAGGMAFAASELGKNSVGTRELKPKAVKTGILAPEAAKTGKIAKKAIVTNRLRNNAVTGAKVNEATLGQVPSAAQADTASSAKNAETADSAKSVDTAAFGVALAGINVNADGSINSWFNRLGGKPSVNVVETGLYDVTYPGISIETDGDNVIQQAAVRAAAFDGELRISGLEGAARIRTSNSAGTASALPFNHVVYGAVPGP